MVDYLIYIVKPYIDLIYDQLIGRLFVRSSDQLINQSIKIEILENK